MSPSGKNSGSDASGLCAGMLLDARLPALIGSLIVVAAVIFAAPASAQDIRPLRNLHQSASSPLPNMRFFSTSDEPESLPVRSRARDEYLKGGIRRSSLIFYPSLTVTPFYDSNVFAAPSGEQSATGIIFSPSLNTESDWNNHQLSLNLQVDHRQYFEATSETRTDAHAILSGRVDVRSDLAVFGAASAARRHEQRGTSNSPVTAAEPVPYDEFDAAVSVVKEFNRLEVAAGVTGEYRNYHDVRASGGGTLDQDYRDGAFVSVGGRIAYLMRPGIRVFGDARYNWRQYNNTPGVNADSQGYNLLAGLEFTLTTLMRGEIGIGYMGQTYDGPGIPDSTGLKYNANLIWNPTPLMTVTLRGERSIEETGLAGSVGRIDSSLELVLDYELRRNVIVSPSIAFSHEDYSGISRTDNIINPALKVDYLFNRNFILGLGYSYTLRDSSVSGVGYDRHYVGVNAQAKF